MSNIRKTVFRQKLWMVGILVLVIGSAAISKDRYYTLGLLIGTTISYVILLLLHRKTIQLAEASGTDGFKRGFGSFTRLILAVLGAYIVVRNDLSIGAYIIGVCIVYPMLLLDYLLFNRKNDGVKEG